MTQQEAAERLASDKCAGIYGYMHGTPWIYEDDHWVVDRIIRMLKEHLTAETEGVVFDWRWTWGTDTLYRYDDYGKTWGFQAEDIEPPVDPPVDPPTEGDGE